MNDETVLPSKSIESVGEASEHQEPEQLTENDSVSDQFAEVCTEELMAIDSGCSSEAKIEEINDESDPTGEAIQNGDVAENVSAAEATERGFSLKAIAQEKFDQNLNWQREQQEWQHHVAELELWQHQTQLLDQGFQIHLSSCFAVLNRFQSLYETSPDHLQEQLKARVEALNIVRRMLDRLVQQAGEQLVPFALDPFPAILSIEDLCARCESPDSEAARRSLDQLLKQQSEHCWQAVSTARDIAQKQRKQFLQFLEKKLLPILDGIDSGEKHSQTLLNTIQDETAEHLTMWINEYTHLRDPLLRVLSELNVYRMNVQIGQQIDFDRHEPIDVETDETLNTEDVKEISRHGYEYEHPSSRLRTVLRCAEVVVVKN